jgi:hypothetical protein
MEQDALIYIFLVLAIGYLFYRFFLKKRLRKGKDRNCENCD